jgi:hypothetical protein
VSYIADWDSDQPSAYWDVGLSWDVNVGPAAGDVTPYLNLVTSEHRNQPNFIAMLSAVFQPLADSQVLTASFPGLYDLDLSVGSQEDATGEWVGVTRDIAVPLTGVFFTWDAVGLGWAEGNWVPDVGATELVSLPDAQYRTLLYATVAANQWDGTIPGAYAVWNTMFAGTGVGILIQDYDDMHMSLALTGPVPDAVTLSLFINGYLDLKPAGVHIDNYYTPVVPDTPYFGWGVENPNISGWGVGYWGVQHAGS